MLAAMKIRLLRALARRPLLAFCSVLALGLAVLVGGLRAAQPRAEATADIQENTGRAILNRLWFDRWPETPMTKVHFLLFMAGGLGMHEEGASYKFTAEFFEFERFGKRLEARFLDDGEKRDVTFKVESCSDLPPFDACLRIENDFRGPRTYYGFAYDEDLTRHLPWTQGELDLARARASHR